MSFGNPPNHFIHILVLSVCIFNVSIALGQDHFDYFRHISTSDGFSLNSVNSIDQDEQGLIWFGTRNGLMRFDGSNLKVMCREPGDAEGRNINDIYTINVDSTIGIWVGSKNGLRIYSYKADSVNDFEWLNASPYTISSRRVFDVLRKSNNQVWIATGAGVDVYNENNHTITSNKFDPNDEESISANRVTALFQSPDGTIWVGTNKGLNEVIADNNGKLKFKKYAMMPSTNLSPDFIDCILEDNGGNLWIGTQRGLFIKRKGQSHFESFESITRQKLTNEIIQDLTMDHHNRLWVATYDGLNIIDENLKIAGKIKHDPKRLNGLTGNNVRALFTDKHGGVWVATYFGGVNYWNENLMNFEKFDERNGTQLGYNVVSAIVQDEDSKVYFGTEGGGINIYDPINRDFSKIDELSFGNPVGAVKAIIYDGDSKFWIGTFDKGLIYLNLKTGTFKEYRKNSEDLKSISADQLVSIEKASDGKLWIGTLNAGLDLFDPKTGNLVNFNADDPNPGINYNNVRALLLTRTGNLFVGTGFGLSSLPYESYKKGDFRFQFLELSNGKENNLYIHDIFEDQNGTIWLGTQSSGLYYIVDNKIVSAGLEGVSNVFSIVEGRNNKLWLSSEEGIVSFNPSSGEHQIYNRKDGVHPNEFNRGAKLAATDGQIYFGGASGVTSFDPGSLGWINKQAPKVIINEFNLLGEELSPDDDLGILNESIEYTREINLDYDQNIFSISFVMPNYINPDKRTYAYRLIGLDDSWVQTTTPFVSYTIQKGGNYVFEVKGINSHGIETDEITKLEININNAPWLTGWAYLLYFTLIAGTLVVLTYFFKSRINLQHKLEMETQMFKHEQEINQQKLQFFTNISHEFRTPLTLISGPLEKLIGDYKGPSFIYRQLLVIKQNTDHLFKLINELMDFRKLESKQMRLRAAEGNIVKFTREIFLSFYQQAKLNNIDYKFHSDESDIRVYFDRDNLEKVLFNLISNAFKYTSSKGAIQVSISNKKGIVSIHVKDDGVGIASDHLEKIFDRFYEVPKRDTTKIKTGSGIGLAIAKNIVDLHKGELEVFSEEGKGSSFIVKLKIGKEHLNEDEMISSFKDSEDISQYYGSEEALIKPIKIDLEATSESNGKQPTILVVEDNADISHFIYNMLYQQYNVHLAENGAVGFQKALAVQPDLIISDVMMPVMDGIAFCSKIKSDIRTSHIPFILLTARTSLVYKFDGLESGADEYLSKPFKIKELLLKCQNIINTQLRLKQKFAETGEFPKTELAVNSIDEEMMNKAIHLIRENIGNEFLNISFLCDELGISRSLLFTKFKSWTDQTPNDYILNVRMRQAATLIEQDKVNISEVGFKVGFKSANYFSKSFKKHFSMSPKAYATKFKKNLGMDS